jgi:hypothetical protein
VQYVSSTPATRLDVINLQVLRWGVAVPARRVIVCPPPCVSPRLLPPALAAAATAALHHPAAVLPRASLPQEQLDQKLQQRQARETGICPIREELYAQCFGA